MIFCFPPTAALCVTVAVKVRGMRGFERILLAISVNPVVVATSTVPFAPFEGINWKRRTPFVV
jgi:hypothetical protein